ncbi:hypothetical protein PAXRUDRAFT_827566 [Paxillus rubicundulus Ve08.2h10]|uniref:Uncharacterized protein n=1 Tax=Paxillus rubicundulus Ve08.2h10 TaxID=930991 RepID=A0A0D0E8D9_9AGAM|nr:hypothetical protein PAXRUDRAFT_827566 [Paxillus rubicundulus Ve08.2h10]
MHCSTRYGARIFMVFTTTKSTTSVEAKGITPHGFSMMVSYLPMGSLTALLAIRLAGPHNEWPGMDMARTQVLTHIHAVD